MATGVHGAVHNVKINLESISDTDYIEDMSRRANALASQADEQCAQILNLLEKRK